MAQSKFLRIKRFGWKRIAKNIMKFGWEMYDATEHTTTTETHTLSAYVDYNNNVRVEDKVDTKSSVRMELCFVRYKEKFVNLGAVKPLELLYNLIFLFRRIIGFFLPFGFLGLFACGVICNQTPDFENILGTIGIWVSVAFVSWTLFIILEQILSSIACKILKYKS